MDLFLFGTLLNPPLLEVVSGDTEVGTKICPAIRPGFQVRRVNGQVFPMLHEDADSVAHGSIVSGLDHVALERLDFYEKAFGYDRVEFTVFDESQNARKVTAYVPEEGRWQPDGLWDLSEWANSYADLTVLTAHEAMSNFGVTEPESMGRRYPQMMARAASRMRAQQSTTAGDLGRDDIDLLKMKSPYTGFFNIAELDLRHKLFDGGMSVPINRTVFVGVDCVIVLPYDPVRDRVLVIEQFRSGPYVRGDENPWTIEPIAGVIDPGETPDMAARREAKEEAGLMLTELHSVSAAYPSPGTMAEFFYVVG